MQYNDFVVIVAVILMLSFLMITRANVTCADAHATAAGHVTQQALPQTENFSRNRRPTNYGGSRYEHCDNNVRELINSATIIDADQPCDLFPEANACKNLPDDWKDMFSHADNTLAH